MSSVFSRQFRSLSDAMSARHKPIEIKTMRAFEIPWGNSIALRLCDHGRE
jgi:hypothetical protein